ncbi:hypothetical protein MY10362_006433 [Beauveria mimosiformis]
MPNAHTSVAIAQVVFYAPMVPLVVYTSCVRFMPCPRTTSDNNNNNNKKKTKAHAKDFFSTVRLAGGIVTIIAEKQPSNTGLWIAALILLNVGVVPLIVANLGLTRLIIQDNHASKPTYTHIVKTLRLLFLLAILLLAGGSGTASVNAHLSRALTLAGYSIFTLELLLLTATQLWLFFPPPHSPHARSAAAAAASEQPPGAGRDAGPLSRCWRCAPRTGCSRSRGRAASRSRGARGTTLTGSALAFALMALLPEYVVLVGWVLVGYAIPARREVGGGGMEGEEDATEQGLRAWGSEDLEKRARLWC